MLKAMPSPRGTNYEKLYVLRGRRPSPSMAYDSKFPVAGRHALDDPCSPSGAEVGRGSRGGKDAIKTIVRWACENLNDEETYELSTLLQSAISETPLGGKGNASAVAGMDAKEIARWRAYGESYARRLVAAKASASAEQEYFARYPNARRLEASANSVVATGTPAKPIVGDATAEREYLARFPNARRLAR